MSNYKILFCLRALKSIVDSFVDTFLVLYFLDVSSENIIPLGIYQLILVLTVYLTIYCCRNLAKSKHRIMLLRVGIVLDLVYFLSIILLKDRIVDYAYLVGALRGLEEGFYYSVYNTIESDGVSNKERTRYIGNYSLVKSTLSVIFPIVFGGMIYATGFVESTTVVLVVVALRMVLSFVFKDKNIPRVKKSNMGKVRQITRGDKRFMYLCISRFFDGLTSSASMFPNIVTIYFITVFSNSISLGIFTAAASVVNGAMGVLFAKFLKKKHYNGMMGISSALTVVALVMMVLDCNVVTIIAFRFLRAISKNAVHLVNEANVCNLCNDPKIKREHKMEYWILVERSLVYGRIVSCILFIMMAFMDSWTPIMMLFAVCLGLFASSAIQFNNAMNRHSRRRQVSRELAPAYETVTKK